MSDSSLGSLIKKALEYFDEKNTENKLFLNNTKSIENIKKNLDIIHEKKPEIPEKNFDSPENKLIIIDSNEKILGDFNVELLGFFDIKTKVWIWSWVMPFLKANLSVQCKFLLKYGLNLEPNNTKNNDEYYLKLILSNSRIIIRDNTQLEILLAIVSYLLGNRIKFIYPVKDKTKPVITYYLVKEQTDTKELD